MFDVFFARTVGEIPMLFKAKSILIRDSNVNWNDFGYYSLFDFRVMEFGRELWTGRLRLGFIGFDESPSEYVSRIFSRTDANLLPADSFAQFFSMQLDEDEYRALLDGLGDKYVQEVLDSLRDIVFLRAFRSSSELLEKALQTDVFALSLIRSDGAFKAFRNSRFIFSPQYRKFVSAPTEMVIPPFSVGSYANQLSFRFRFVQEGILPKRISVVVGPNGVGKTRSLHQALDFYLGESNYAREGRKVIAIPTPGDEKNNFPPPSSYRNSEYVLISTSNSDLSRSDEALTETILNLSRERWQDADSFRWHIFHRAVSGILPFSALAFVREDYEHDYDYESIIDFSELTSRGEYSTKYLFSRLSPDFRLALQHGNNYYSLSSGQLSFIKLAAQLSAHVTEGSLVLIDEPETHLHPKFVSQFIGMLDSILAATRSTAIISTHSPFVVREVPNDQVHIVYKTSMNGLGVARPRLKTFGADVGAIAASVFGDELVNDGLDRLIENILNEPVKYKNWESDLFNELSVAAVLYIRRMLKDGEDRK